MLSGMAGALLVLLLAAVVLAVRAALARRNLKVHQLEQQLVAARAELTKARTAAERATQSAMEAWRRTSDAEAQLARPVEPVYRGTVCEACLAKQEQPEQVEVPPPPPVAAPAETPAPDGLLRPDFIPPHIAARAEGWGDAWAQEDERERLEELARMHGGDWSMVGAHLAAAEGQR